LQKFGNILLDFDELVCKWNASYEPKTAESENKLKKIIARTKDKSLFMPFCLIKTCWIVYQSRDRVSGGNMFHNFWTRGTQYLLSPQYFVIKHNVVVLKYCSGKI